MNTSAIPNLLTGGRLVLGLVMFVCLAGSTNAIPFLSNTLTMEQQFGLQKVSLVAFALAATTDWVDGMAARKLNAESVWGAILDPIADKLLVAGTILGLSALGNSIPGHAHIVTAGAIILFREFFVSALREVGAKRGVGIPVSRLAKWKTTIQLVALGAQLLVSTGSAWNLQSDATLMTPLTVAANILMWVAAVVTVWTGYAYWAATRKRLAA
jgi:CDP-diacylglycerol--glycerol-3-phosphate 3-phosphatidyltransferase